MKPGVTSAPLASRTRSAASGAEPTATIFPSRMPMSPEKRAAPVPSTMVPPTIFRSYM